MCISDSVQGFRNIAESIIRNAQVALHLRVIRVLFRESFPDCKSLCICLLYTSFCGMMNSEDQLFITDMIGVLYNPRYKPYSADLSSGGIQGCLLYTSRCV